MEKNKINCKTAGAIHKPNFVSGSGYPANRTTIIHLWRQVALSLLRLTRGLWTGSPKSPLYLVLHQVGFTELPRSPGKLVRSYRTFSPLPVTLMTGGILSVALSFTSPRLHVMEHPALWCSDFPLNQKMIQRSSELLRPSN